MSLSVLFSSWSALVTTYATVWPSGEIWGSLRRWTRSRSSNSIGRRSLAATAVPMASAVREHSNVSRGVRVRSPGVSPFRSTRARLSQRGSPEWYLFSDLSEYSSLWWRLSRCDNPAAFSGGTIDARRLGLDESIAPLDAALLVAARRVPPLLNTHPEPWRL